MSGRKLEARIALAAIASQVAERGVVAGMVLLDEELLLALFRAHGYEMKEETV